MKLKTSRFGEIEISEDDIIPMVGGIIGFPEQKRYVMLRHGKNSPFFWYQSVDNPELAFVLTNPLLFIPDYRINIGNGELEGLKISDYKSLGIFVILTIPRGKPQEATANLLSPLLINTEKRLAKQIILKDSSYTTRHPIMPESQRINRPVKIKNEQRS